MGIHVRAIHTGLAIRSVTRHSRRATTIVRNGGWCIIDIPRVTRGNRSCDRWRTASICTMLATPAKRRFAFWTHANKASSTDSRYYNKSSSHTIFPFKRKSQKTEDHVLAIEHIVQPQINSPKLSHSAYQFGCDECVDGRQRTPPISKKRAE